MIPRLSIIIPILNEREKLPALLKQLESWKNPYEIILVDGGSTDGTLSISLPQSARFYQSKKGRAIQMNIGATEAKGDYLLFLHADSQLSKDFYSATEAFMQEGGSLANYLLQFDDPHWWLALQAFFSRFTHLSFQFGDQGLLVKQSLFEEVGGFNEKMLLLEDQEILQRLTKKAKLHKLKARVITSARKYQKVGYFKLQFIYFRIYWKWKQGASQLKLQELLNRLVAKADKVQPSVNANSTVNGDEISYGDKENIEVSNVAKGNESVKVIDRYKKQESN